MTLRELAAEIKRLPCDISGYAAEWRWALTSDWWQLTIAQVIFTLALVFLTITFTTAAWSDVKKHDAYTKYLLFVLLPLLALFWSAEEIGVYVCGT